MPNDAKKAHNVLRTSTGVDYTVCVIGAGPGGLSVAAALLDQGLPQDQLLVVDRGDVGQAWLDYPPETHLLSESSPTKDDNMIADIPTSEVFSNIPHPSHVMYQKYLQHVVTKKHINFKKNTTVKKVYFDQHSNSFQITLRNEQHLTAKFVVWAAGMFSNPNDDMDMEGCSIHYAKLPYINDIEANEITVVGSANGATGVVMELAKPGRKVYLVTSREYNIPMPIDCLWKENMQFVKELEMQGLVEIIEHFRVKRIYKEDHHYVLESEDGQHRTAADKPIICTGFLPNIEPIESMLETVCRDRETFLLLDETHQSVKQPGLFVAGSIGKLEHDEGFIRNFRNFAGIIAEKIITSL